jgi:hypothetical protein
MNPESAKRSIYRATMASLTPNEVDGITRSNIGQKQNEQMGQLMSIPFFLDLHLSLSSSGDVATRGYTGAGDLIERYYTRVVKLNPCDSDWEAVTKAAFLV